MKKARLSLTLALSIMAAPIAANADEGDLITHMGNLQMFMHKAALSLDASNPELLYFYTHEIEETIEAVEETEKFKNYDIEALIKETLVPEFEKFEDLVKAKDLAGADKQYGNMIKACNSCHNSVERGYIKMKRIDSNPYMQDFSK
jgi:hypothetical protein